MSLNPLINKFKISFINKMPVYNSLVGKREIRLAFCVVKNLWEKKLQTKNRYLIRKMRIRTDIESGRRNSFRVSL